MKPAVVLPFIAQKTPDCRSSAGQKGLVSSEAVRTQLAKILKSDGFVRASRMRRFLNFVVEETLAGRSHLLCEYTVGLEVFDRRESFEPGIDPIVRNDARRLRQKLFEYYQTLGSDGGNQVVIEVPRGSYVPVFRSSSESQIPRSTEAQYRLVVSLIRIADGAEIWSLGHDCG
jgi:serine/threonine-protein kinase